MKKFKLVIIYIICVITITNVFTSCKKNTIKSAEKGKINAYVDIKDPFTLEIIRFITEEYKKEKKDVEINFNNPLGNEKFEEDIVKGDMDLIFTSRDKMIELAKKGLLNDMGEFYTKNKMSEKYYNIMGAYGRIGDKYYGVGLFPNSLEVFYNSEALSKLNLSSPRNLQDLVAILKKLNESKIKVPVLLSEGMDIKNAIASIIFSNTVNMAKLEESYDSGMENYSKLNIQQVFAAIDSLVKQGSIKEDTLENAGDGTVKRLINGDIPVMIAVSKISADLKNKLSVEVLKDYNLSNTKSNVPVIVNAVASTPANSKNEEMVNDFLEFIYSDKTQKKLAEKGLVTGSKSVNGAAFSVGTGYIIGKHLEEADSNSIYFLYNFPEKFQPYIESALNDIFKGKYKGTEWKDILSEVYK